MLGKNYYDTLIEYVDDDQIPLYLGGSNPATFIEDRGPWQDYELIDSNEPGAVVGVKRKDDPNGKIFTQDDYIQLENPNIGKGVMGTNGAVVRKQDGSYIPNTSANKSTPIDPEQYAETS